MILNSISLKEKCNKYRKTTEFKLNKDLPIILMLDGRGFSKFCKRFEKPFSDDFINIMDKVAIELCKSIQNAKFSYVQSDEISIFIDKSKENSQSWFDGRFNKICSVAAGIASSVFTREYIKLCIEKSYDINNIPTISFDCKAWNVNNNNDVFAWFLFRNLDCIKNSKQMMAQTYLSHKKLLGLNSDEQIKLLKTTTGHNWTNKEDKYKYGRVIYKETAKLFSEEYNVEFDRNIWTTEHNENLLPFNEKNSKEKFINFIVKK